MSDRGLPKVMVVEDDPGLRTQLKWALSRYDVCLAEDRPNALALLEKENPSIVILDLGLPPDRDGASEGLAALKTILSLSPETKVIVASGNDDRKNALEAISGGAYDFYSKPLDQAVLEVIINRAWNCYQLEEEIRTAAEVSARSPFQGIIAACPEMLEVCRMADRVAHSDVSVLITGESGTGKDLLAKGIHAASPRKECPFIAINCAAIPEPLLESELFGHEKGAFTGAVRQTVGKIEQANGGTLFLDEIGDMPLSLQAKLLRFLQERTIVRVGGLKSIEVSLRIIAATNKDLRAMLQDGTFREDLFYRLNEVGIHIPPMRERPGDVLLIAHFLLKQLRAGVDRSIKGFTPDALRQIDEYSWPGNIREMENRIKRAIVLTDGKYISAKDLGFELDLVPADSVLTIRKAREEADRRTITRAMLLGENNISEVARLLGVTRPTLYDLMKSLNIQREV